ncbi:MAG TPA: UDP-N-acetylmuramoyl-tripeptide--D-alanyl-D-alanine ligase [Gammaproteobacteria bacterium]|nr:UDP-N-acetylmuramoyl-tripeptide--D-alanyl-D-alanine ligase [Gammaproteobacteria bacterium]
MPLSQAAQILDAKWLGTDVTFHGISTDTRTLAEGNLFVALQGPNFDGHDYLEQAQKMGAVAAAVTSTTRDGLPMLQVEDTRLALGELAAHWRTQFRIPVIAVTGSNGKTSVREMLASILRCCGEALVTKDNFNNDIGVPQTLFGLTVGHDYAVIELGANHPGEIAYLADIVRPTVALINNAGPAHLEGFGDLSGVARAKGELFERIPADAVCIINTDDAYAELWRSLAASRRIISFGMNARADVRAGWKGDIDGSDIRLVTPMGAKSFRLTLPGQHNVMNALAAAAAALAVEIPPARIAEGLSRMQPVHGRWESQPGMGGIQLIDDTYNANPGSLQVALDLLSRTDAETWLVLGDMGELGPTGERLHRKVGEEAREAGVRRLFSLGELAQQAAVTFGEGAESFSDVDSLNAQLQQQVCKGVTVLVKGSRAMRMERVVEALRAGGVTH